jgi:hypothetical protein
VSAGGTFRRDGAPGAGRIVAVPAGDPVALLERLVRELPEPLVLVYVLLASGTLRPEGRWQSSAPVSRADALALLGRFRAFLAGDGRHALWIASAHAPAGLVLDRRGAVTLHGAAKRFLAALAAEGLAEGAATPGPAREPRPEHDLDENALLAALGWTWFPLEPGDDWLEA